MRESLTQGLTFVPSVADGRNRTNLQWVTATLGPRGDRPPALQELAGQLSRVAGQVEPAFGRAQADLARHSTSPRDAASEAAAVARSHVGAARAELLAVLAQRLA